MSEDYPWYECVHDETILQGDLLPDCPILAPPVRLTDTAQEPEQQDVSYELYDVVVMSQSCDLVQEKVQLVLLSPYGTVTHFQDLYPAFRDRNLLENIRRGNVPGYHMLSKHEEESFHDQPLIVDFRSTFSVPFAFLKDFVRDRSSRLRLLPPYREHLSQAFARFLMRVGLPEDIPSFT